MTIGVMEPACMAIQAEAAAPKTAAITNTVKEDQCQDVSDIASAFAKGDDGSLTTQEIGERSSKDMEGRFGTAAYSTNATANKIAGYIASYGLTSSSGNKYITCTDTIGGGDFEACIYYDTSKNRLVFEIEGWVPDSSKGRSIPVIGEFSYSLSGNYTGPYYFYDIDSTSSSVVDIMTTVNVPVSYRQNMALSYKNYEAGKYPEWNFSAAVQKANSLLYIGFYEWERMLVYRVGTGLCGLGFINMFGGHNNRPAGNCYMRCSYCGRTVKATIRLSATKKKLKKKKSYVLKVGGLVDDDYWVRATVSNKKIATIKQYGKNGIKITAKKKKGKVTVKVYLRSGKTATCKVTVK